MRGILSSKECELNKRGSFLRMSNIISGTIPIFFELVRIKSFDGVCMGKKLLIFSKLVMKDPPGAIIVQISPLGKYLMPVAIGQQSTKMPMNFMGPFPSSRRNKYILVAVDYLSKWVEAKTLPINDARVVIKFLKSLFARFGTPRAIISDRGTHFYNDKFAKVMSKKERTGEKKPCLIGQYKLDMFMGILLLQFKHRIGCTPYKLVYGKSCHLPIELEHKAY
ncbi:reverse transcriptase domain-containing protein [Tanacetum coccineum]